jgi:hypothetical protein
MPRRSLDVWLIDLATTNPPPGREDWADAMRAEFDELRGGRVSWALGCLGATIGWRIQAERAFILTGVLVALILVEGVPWLTFYLVAVLGEPFLTILRSVAYGWTWCPVVASCAILAAMRPQYWLSIGLTVVLIDEVSNWLKGALAFHQPVSTFFSGSIMDARFDVGMGALIGYALIGSLIGKALRNIAPTAAYPR